MMMMQRALKCTLRLCPKDTYRVSTRVIKHASVLISTQESVMRGLLSKNTLRPTSFQVLWATIKSFYQHSAH